MLFIVDPKAELNMFKLIIRHVKPCWKHHSSIKDIGLGLGFCINNNCLKEMQPGRVGKLCFQCLEEDFAQQDLAPYLVGIHNSVLHSGV